MKGVFYLDSYFGVRMKRNNKIVYEYKSDNELIEDERQRAQEIYESLQKEIDKTEETENVIVDVYCSYINSFYDPPRTYKEWTNIERRKILKWLLNK